MRPDSWKVAAILALLAAASSIDVPQEEGALPLCHTDAECSLLCDEVQMQLPPDHPDYCDGGPAGGSPAAKRGLPGEEIWL